MQQINLSPSMYSSIFIHNICNSLCIRIRLSKLIHCTLQCSLSFVHTDPHSSASIYAHPSIHPHFFINETKDIHSHPHSSNHVHLHPISSPSIQIHQFSVHIHQNNTFHQWIQWCSPTSIHIPLPIATILYIFINIYPCQCTSTFTIITPICLQSAVHTWALMFCTYVLLNGCLSQSWNFHSWQHQMLA